MMTVLSFYLDGEQYCINTSYVVEVMEEVRSTPIPQSDSYMTGLINLRGLIVPVVDLRLRFGLNAGKSGKESIIVVSLTLDYEVIQVGLLVDSVYDVIDIIGSEVKPLAGFTNSEMSEFFEGILDWNDTSLIVLDIKKTIRETDFIKKISTNSP